MRTITHLVLHCTATPINTKIANIQDYWKNTMKWSNPGYHYIIDYAGKIHSLLPEDKIANGVAGYNACSIHISYIGGIDMDGKPLDTRSPGQRAAQIALLRDLRQRYPHADICGHRDFPGVHKACPSFDVKAWLKTAGI